MISYTHTQSSASADWTIDHGMNVHPVVEVIVVVNGARQQIQPLSVEYVDANNIVIHFSEPRAGTAQLIGRTDFEFAQTPNLDASDSI